MNPSAPSIEGELSRVFRYPVVQLQHAQRFILDELMPGSVMLTKPAPASRDQRVVLRPGALEADAA